MQVDIENFCKLGFIDLMSGAPTASNAGIIYSNIYAAEGGNGCGNARPNLNGILNVEG